MRKNNARINEKKNAQEAKNYTQAMRYIRCLYTKKNDKFRIEQSSTRGIVNFRA